MYMCRIKSYILTSCLYHRRFSLHHTVAAISPAGEMGNFGNMEKDGLEKTVDVNTVS